MKSVRFTFLALTSSIILTGCGGGNRSFNKTFDINAALSVEADIPQAERNVAARICYAYQTKSKDFRVPGGGFLGTRFVFETKKTDCQNLLSTHQIPTTLNYDQSNQLVYTPQNVADANLQLMGKVQTDTSGYLSSVCSKIVTNAPISNTVTSGSLKVQISFFRDTLDGFSLEYFQLQPDNTTYKKDSSEIFRVRTKIDWSSGTGQILGMDEFYSTQKRCGSSFDKKEFSDFKQTFISR